MSTDEPITYRQAVKDVRAWAREAYDEDPGHPDPDELAWECIDGCEYVIYYYQARALYDDSAEVREWEDQISDVIKPDASIDERIAACVFLALKDAWHEAWNEYESNSQPTEPDPDDEEDE